MEPWDRCDEWQKLREICSDHVRRPRLWRKSSNTASETELWGNEATAQGKEGVVRGVGDPHIGERAVQPTVDAL